MCASSLACGTEISRWNWAGLAAQGASTPALQAKAPSAAATVEAVASHELAEQVKSLPGTHVRDAFDSLPV